MISLDISDESDSSIVPDQSETQIINAFLSGIKRRVDVDYAHEPLTWIWVESYLNGNGDYGIQEALTYSAFPLLTKPRLLRQLAKSLQGKAPSKVTSNEWTQYIIEYADDNIGATASKAVRCYLELCIVTKIGKELRLIHEPTLLHSINNDTRLLREIRAGIEHFLPNEPFKKSAITVGKLLEPNGFNVPHGHARTSPLVRAAYRSQPDPQSPTNVATDFRKRRSYANRMVSPVHRYKYPMPKLNLEGLTSRTRYSRLFRFISGRAFPARV